MSLHETFEELLEIKRDGHEHTKAQIERLVAAFTAGVMPDYQMSAWLMAVYLNGLSPDETVWLTDAMVRSGRVIDLSTIPGVKVDKHSTGGVADTTTLVLAPLVAACGVPVAKMSGRGLGHTGGTLDKLDSIPGFRTQLTAEEFVSQVCDVGVAVIAQSPDVAPADKLMYALRDVTATVPSIPLIVGSIISKKIAGGADAVVLDVKVGSGAFMKTVQEAQELADELSRVGHALGRDVQCVLTDMDQPLGMAVGNSLEIVEAMDTLSGHGPAALTELCLVFGERMLVLAGRAQGQAEARELLLHAISSGEAIARFRSWIEAQGGDGRIVEDRSVLPTAAHSRELRADLSGHVQGFDAQGVGRAAMALGAGRASTDDVIDLAAGLVMAVRAGDPVSPGTLLCTLYTDRPDTLDDADDRFREAIRVGPDCPEPRPLILGG